MPRYGPLPNKIFEHGRDAHTTLCNVVHVVKQLDIIKEDERGARKLLASLAAIKCTAVEYYIKKSKQETGDDDDDDTVDEIDEEEVDELDEWVSTVVQKYDGITLKDEGELDADVWGGVQNTDRNDIIGQLDRAKTHTFKAFACIRDIEKYIADQEVQKSLTRANKGRKVLEVGDFVRLSVQQLDAKPSGEDHLLGIAGCDRISKTKIMPCGTAAREAEKNSKRHRRSLYRWFSKAIFRVREVVPPETRGHYPHQNLDLDPSGSLYKLSIIHDGINDVPLENQEYRGKFSREHVLWLGNSDRVYMGMGSSAKPALERMYNFEPPDKYMEPVDVQDIPRLDDDIITKPRNIETILDENSPYFKMLVAKLGEWYGCRIQTSIEDSDSLKKAKNGELHLMDAIIDTLDEPIDIDDIVANLPGDAKSIWENSGNVLSDEDVKTLIGAIGDVIGHTIRVVTGFKSADKYILQCQECAQEMEYDEHKDGAECPECSGRIVKVQLPRDRVPEGGWGEEDCEYGDGDGSAVIIGTFSDISNRRYYMSTCLR